MPLLDRRSFLAAAAASAFSPFARGQARRPNIVIILADDLGYGELTCQGVNTDIPTPHIDSIARSGVRFTQGYVSAPLCCPSRAGLMTGRFQTRFGHEMNLVGDQNLNPNVGLPLTETTLGSALHDAGYATAIFGKWHLGTAAPYRPQRRGFDEFFGFLHEGHFYTPPPYRGMMTRLRTNEPPYDDENPLFRGNSPVSEPEYLTQAFTREATSFIERNASRPFFLYLPYNAIHSPMQALVTDVQRFQDSIHDEQRRVFAGMLSQLDEGVGKVLDTLRAHNLEQDTLVAFLSDNGGPTRELTSSNTPLRGGKGQMFEGGIRIPYMMRWPGHIPAGRTMEAAVSSLDLFPTACAAAGAKLPANPLDGVDLMPYITGKAAAPARNTLFWRLGRNIAIRRDEWKLVRQGSDQFQLFNLDKDVSETTDLAGRETAVASAMRRELDALNAQMVAPLWGG